MTWRATRLSIRAVNGWGPRCGCGGESAVHLTGHYGPVSPQTSVFLCLACVERAILLLRDERPDQPPYWPGDEGRDEPYVAPAPAREEPAA